MRSATFRSLMAVTALGTLAIPAANALDVKMYGTVNKALMGFNDGTTTETNIVDNSNESTKFGIGGEQKLDNGLTASVLLEMGQTSNSSNAITQNIVAGQANTPTNIGGTLTERIARVGLANDFGALFIGQQDLATDDAFTHDLAAASSVINPNVGSFGGALKFRTSTGAVVAPGGTDLTPGLFAQGNDGSLVANDSVRLNTATFAGFNGSVSVAQGGNVDATVRYANTYGDFSVDSALGHTFVNNNATTAGNELEGQTLGSVSVKHKSGLAATVAYAGQSLDHKTAGVDEAEGYYGKVGYAWDAFGVAAEYGQFKNPIAVAADQKMNVYGVGAEYDLGHGVSTGVLYRNFDAKVTGINNIEDIDVYTASMRVKF